MVERKPAATRVRGLGHGGRAGALGGSGGIGRGEEEIKVGRRRRGNRRAHGFRAVSSLDSTYYLMIQ